MTESCHQAELKIWKDDVDPPLEEGLTEEQNGNSLIYLVNVQHMHMHMPHAHAYEHAYAHAHAHSMPPMRALPSRPMAHTALFISRMMSIPYLSFLLFLRRRNQMIIECG